ERTAVVRGRGLVLLLGMPFELLATVLEQPAGLIEQTAHPSGEVVAERLGVGAHPVHRHDLRGELPRHLLESCAAVAHLVAEAAQLLRVRSVETCHAVAAFPVPPT